MATFSVLAARAVPGGGLGGMDGAAGAMIRAADKYSRGLGARTGGPADARALRRPGPSVAGEPGRPAGRDMLPEGFLPLREVKDLALLGRWPLLEDRMSACMPTRIIAAMQRRSSLGDHEAEAWLKMHALACAGDPEAQRAFGRICENGSYRAPADLQRAFFWYYRAGLQGDIDGRRSAERLMQRSPRISPTTMAEPMLIYPGEWRITAHLSDQLRSASQFELLDDGTATGWLIEGSEAGAGGPDPDGCTPSSRMPKACYRGGWAYDAIGQMLTLIFESEGGERRWRNAGWQIELLGCKPGAIFGCDRRRVGYTLEHPPRGAAREA